VRDLAAETTTVMPSAGGGLGLAFGLASLSDDGTRIAYGQFGPPDQFGYAPYGVVAADTASATVVVPVAGGILSHQGQSNFDVALSGDGGIVAFLFVNSQLGTLHRFELEQPGLVPVPEGLGSPGVVRVLDDGIVFGLVDSSGYVVTDAAGSPLRVVSADPFGGPAATVDQQSGDLSGDGRFVAFASSDPDLLPGDTNGVSDVFVRATAQSMTAPS